MTRRRWLTLCLTLLLMAGLHAGQAAAERIGVQGARLEMQEGHWVVNAQFDLDLTARLEEAVSRGLPLYFLVEFELTRPRWYWFDEKAISSALRYRLSYNALTRQYRLSTGTLQQGFPTLQDAIGVMTSVRNWRVAESDAIKAGETYFAALRMRLDVSQLPKPFQINAITDREWTMASDWERFTVTGEAAR